MQGQLFQQIRRTSDRVGLREIQFYAYHGHRREENSLGQRFLLSLDAWLDLSTAGHSDQLGDTLNYFELHRLVMEWVTANRFSLLERLVEGLADAIFAAHPEVDALRLCVQKPQPPIPDFFGFVEVEICRVSPRLLTGKTAP